MKKNKDNEENFMKVKLMFYVDCFLVGGIEKVLIEYLNNVNKEKFDVSLVIAYKLNELEKLKENINSDIKVEYVLEDDIFCNAKKKKSIGKLSKFEKILNESLSFYKKLKMKKKILDLAKQNEIIVDFDMTLSPYINEINKLKNIKKTIAFSHFSLLNYHRGIKSRQKKLGKRLNNYSKVVVISNEMKKEAVKIYPFLENKIERFYNSFNIEKMLELADDFSEIEKKDLEEKYILAIGRLEETQKDFTTLIKAYSLIEREIEEKLFIIGEGRHKEQLENLVKSLKLKNKIKFLGFKKNPYPYIKNASLFIHSSKFEGLPTVMIEALIFQKFIVATDCPTGPREILSNGENGILTKIGDEKSLANGIIRILKDKTDNEKFIKNLREHIKEFDSKEVMKKFERFIEN